jgi:hypothetical protein
MGSFGTIYLHLKKVKKDSIVFGGISILAIIHLSPVSVAILK